MTPPPLEVDTRLCARARSVAWIWLLCALPSLLSAELKMAEPGPWGQLEYYETVLEPPESHIWPPLYSEETVWFFERMDIAEVLARFAEVELPEEHWRQIPDSSWHLASNGVMLKPPHSLVGALTPEQRSALYPPMMNIAKTTPWVSGFNVEGGSIRDLVGADLPEEIIQRIEQVSFMRGDILSFTDLPWLLSQIPDPALKTKVIRILSRTTAIMARLRVTPDSDLEALADYWSTPGQSNSPLPLLQSAQHDPEGHGTVDLIHLLPVTARQYVYTYLNPEKSVMGVQADCFWAAFNFSQHEVSDRALDNTVRHGFLLRDYAITEKPSRFGDLIILRRVEDLTLLHAWVEIADDLVFTKNGSSLLHPWILMKRENMLSRYSTAEETEMQVFRPITANRIARSN